MKRRKPKRKHKPGVKSVALDAEPVDEAAIEVETQNTANPSEAQAKTESYEISDELQREIENSTNSFDVQRHAGTGPAPVEPPASSGPPARRSAPGLRSVPAAAADRRANRRYAFNATAEVVAADSGAKTKTRVRDLSQQGCYLDADNPLPLGTTVQVRMTKGAKSLEVHGRVVYIQPGRGMGLMFTAVKPEHGRTLDSWILESAETSWLAANRRRSQRVLMKVPVSISVQAGGAVLTEEETYTLAVSAHGALLAVSTPLYRGQRLTLSNPQAKDSLECVVAHIDRFRNDQAKVGVEFLLPNPTFWHVAFPPKDWSPRHPDAKRQPSQGSLS